MAERAILHGRVELGVVEPVELEHEEQQMRGSRREALLHVGVEFCARGIDRVAGMDEAGKGSEAADEIVELLVALHRLGERGSRVRPLRKRGELALVGVFERDAFGIGSIEIALHMRIVYSRVESARFHSGNTPNRPRPQGEIWQDFFDGARFACVVGIGIRGVQSGNASTPCVHFSVRFQRIRRHVPKDVANIE